MIQMTAPTRDRRRATSANGSPNKKPSGLHSPILLFPFSLPNLEADHKFCYAENEKEKQETRGFKLNQNRLILLVPRLCLRLCLTPVTTRRD